MSEPAVSVVVVTRDRPQALERCLTSLTWQRGVALEIVVVDDASADAEAVGEAVARSLRAADVAPPTHIVGGEARGPAAARNLGVAVAAGPVVCFIDDDCVAAPGWARRLALACAGGDAAAGVTVADPVAGRAAAASQLLTDTLQRASLDPETNTLGFAPTCNLACPAGLLRELPFDESFALAAGEDRDWCARLAAAGAALRFVPQACVEHRPSMGIAGLVRQQVRYGRGAVHFRAAAAERRLSGPAFYRLLAREAVRAGPLVAGLVLIAQVAVAAGALLESRHTRARA